MAYDLDQGSSGIAYGNHGIRLIRRFDKKLDLFPSGVDISGAMPESMMVEPDAHPQIKDALRQRRGSFFRMFMIRASFIIKVIFWYKSTPVRKNQSKA